MPLASGSFPYPKHPSKNAISPMKDDETGFASSSDNTKNTDTRASSQTYRSTFDNVDDKLGADKLSPTSEQNSSSSPTNVAMTTPATPTVVGRFVLPLEERPNDQKRIRKIISASPLIAMSAVFAAMAVFLSESATRFTWLDYSVKFNNLLKGVETTTRHQWYQDREIVCISANPSGIDPDVIEGCVDHGITETFMKWLPMLNQGAMVFGAIAFGLAVLSSRHLRWWMAKFTSPTARIMFIVGDVTGNCGTEPEWCKVCHCRDCGLCCTPANPAIFATISAILHLISFTVYWFISRPYAIYRTEGPWLIITAGGLQMGSAYFAFWSQKVVCPVRHVWSCDVKCKVDKHKAKHAHHQRKALEEAGGDSHHDPPEQGVPHLLGLTTVHAERIHQLVRKQSSRLVEKSNEIASKLATRIRQKALERLPRNPDEEDEEEEEEVVEAPPPGPTGPFSQPFQPKVLKPVSLVGTMKKSSRRLVPPGQSLQARAALLKRQSSNESVHTVVSPSNLDTNLDAFPMNNNKNKINNSSTIEPSSSSKIDNHNEQDISNLLSEIHNEHDDTVININH